MKTMTLMTLFAVFGANAQDHHEVNLFDERIVVEVKTETANDFDETPLWEVLDQKGWQAAKQAIEGNPVSDVLVDEITYRESIEKLSSAIKTQRYSAADALLKSNEQWLSCERIQWVWLDLQREVVSGYGENTKAKYQYALDNCEGYEQSTATKLFGWAGANAGADIVARYRKSAGFDEKVAARMENDVMLATLSKNSVSDHELSTALSNVESYKDGKAAEILGWKYIKREDAKSALNWFEKSIQWAGPTQKRVEGKLLSLQQLGELEQLHQEHQQWVEQFPNLTDLTFGSDDEAPIHCEGSAGECLRTLSQKSQLNAEEYALQGWKLYEIGRPMSASMSFERALDMMDANSPERGLTQYGYVLSLQKFGFSDKAQALALNIDDAEKRIEIDRQLAMKRVFNAFNAKEYGVALSHIRNYEMAYGKDVKLIEVKAWSLYNSQKKLKALKEYSKLTEAFPHNEDYKHSYMIIRCGLATKDPKCKKYNS
ncbi:hypothetical protein LRP49_01330 [Enterovibrio sp. ZSDZ35]|uniref:Tetratricopeptide repeat-containing protein n=1 Tax=Enterovibrio qingdaonensis TaxID=2899818 RepID=A0ABT5QFR8_9GAMM|nr:hypothetical protein [Enterovibrio sp. ZSDZ35]MDD1779825.1 hypothetical protein [Enterovibrio sp. ZSDZ35]